MWRLSRLGSRWVAGKEEVSETLSGLQQDTEYSVCLVVHNESKEEAMSAVVSFTTALPPETPETLKAEPVGSTGVTLRGVLNPGAKGEAGSFEFVYRASSTECQGEGEEKVGGEALGEKQEAVSNEVGGLSPNTAYSVCLLARNAAGETAVGAPVSFVTLPQTPGVSGESVSHVGSVSAMVSAQIDTGGIEANYRVQYGTTVSYGTETPVTNLAPGSTSVTVPLSGLQPNTEYHFRFVATNHDGVEPGADVSFTTYTTSPGVLPDDRVYEMVSPPENHNADVYNVENNGLFFTRSPFEAAADGNAIVYEAAPTTGGNGSSGNEEGNAYRASRSPAGTWSQTNITPAGSLVTTEYEAFSSDLSTGFISVRTVPPLVTAEVPKQFESALEEKEVYTVLYSRSFDESDFRPLFSRTSPYRPGEEFEAAFRVGSTFGSPHRGRPAYAGASADLSHDLFEANDALLEGNGQLETELNANVAKEAKETREAIGLIEEGVKILRRSKIFGSREALEAEGEALEAVGDRDELYVSVAGRLSLVNVSSEGRLMPGATFGGTPSGFTSQEAPGFSHVISADGSRVFWTSVENAQVPDEFNELFIARPLAIYVREDGSRTIQVSPGPAQFRTASTDGKYAFYIEAGKLWRFDVEDRSRVELAGSDGGVQGVIGTNETGEDGAYVYFVAHEAFSNTENDAKQKPVAEADNLYVYEPDPAKPGASRVVFIGTLSESDSSDWSLSLSGRTSNFTPDGRNLVFTSHENLTGNQYPGEGGSEVYAYDTQDSSLYCASCRPQASGGHLNPTHNLTYVYRWISEDGDRVFFDSSAPLVSQDINNAQDVYEWERDGHYGCEESNGCVYLISNGFGEQSSFVDASATGNDVFFVTPDKLTPEDGNENVDMYDARVNGARPVAAP